MKDFLTIGQIVNTHGLKGEVKVYPLTDDLKRFKSLNHAYINNEERNIVNCKFQKDRVILKIEGIETIEEAEKYKNAYIKVTRKQAVPLEENAYYIADIINCNVYDEENILIGKVYDVIKTGSNDVYCVKSKKEDILIPAIKSVILNVDINNSKIIIKPLKEWQG